VTKVGKGKWEMKKKRRKKERETQRF